MPTAAARAARTAHHVASSRRLGLAKRPRRRLPKQLPPKGIQREYTRALLALVARMRPAFAELEAALPALLESARRARFHADGVRADAGETERARVLLARARAALAGSVTQRDIEALAREFAKKTATWQRVQLNAQVKAALGADVFLRDAALAELTKGFVAENAELITAIPRKVADDVAGVVMGAVQGGRLHADIAEELDAKFQFGEDRAKRIARDQVLSFYADVDQARQRELGVSRFVWRTVHDDRVRGDPSGLYPKAKTSHYDLDGKTFSYADPPLNDEGIPILPGQEINCRCFAEPVFDDILNS